MLEKQTPLECPQCHQKTLYHNKGVSKIKKTFQYPNGVPYENHKCSNPTCRYIKWEREEKKPEGNMQPPEGWQKPTVREEEPSNAMFQAEVIAALNRLEDSMKKIIDEISLNGSD